ncbi:MAG TPA: hypothetical protein VF817_01290 [Patescibacteria group bacterium]
MKKIIFLSVVFFLSVSSNAFAERSIGGSIVGLVKAAVIDLPAGVINGATSIVTGVADGFDPANASPRTISVVQPVQTYVAPQQEETVVWMYTQPPVIPSYQFNGWYFPRPDYIVFRDMGGRHHWHPYRGSRY